ncbi:uncharacterized protein [Linepithema humile]|uniref:uncharacterized protein n=1 Tax=Linepithema humile TaxID=83485 RepID=UPI00351E2458
MKVKNKNTVQNKQKIKIAMNKVLSGELSIRKASERYAVPKSTLFDNIKVIKQGGEVSLYSKKGFKKTFDEIYEMTLKEHVVNLSHRCMPLTKKEFQKLAFDLAESLKIDHRFNKEKKMAGKHFYYDFIKRNPGLSLRTPEPTSLLRSVGFNRPQVKLFYDNLKSLYEKYNFEASDIFNCDETGVSTVHKQQKVLAVEGIRQVGNLTSAERGKNVTVMFCMSAAGFFLPPYFIFPRQRIPERLMIGAPPQSVAVAQSNGWMNGELFVKWLQHFVKFSKPTAQKPVLLILDGHCSHKELAVINFAKENHVHMLSTPPHTTHKLQLLDRVFMKPFKNAYYEVCALWMRANAGVRISEYEIVSFVAKSFNQVARLQIATSGFQCTGIYPYNPNIFTDLDFLPSEITDIPVENDPKTGNLLNLPINPSTSSNKLPQPFQAPGPSAEKIKNCIEELSPLPNAAAKRLTSRKRRSEKSAILTSSSYKKTLEEKENVKLEKSIKKPSSNKLQNSRGKKTTNKLEIPRGKKTYDRSKVKNSNCRLTVHNAKEKTACVICLEDNEEDWIQCCSCMEWAHEACADIPETKQEYICDRCTLF